MTKIITIHSFRGGTGKSTLTGTLATELALAGKRVCILDTDMKSPGVHVLFGIDESPKNTLNDYLYASAPIEETVYDVGKHIGVRSGALLLVPSAIAYEEISEVLLGKLNQRKLLKGIDRLSEKFKLDYLFVDTHPGLNAEALLAAQRSDFVFVLMRPNNQDYQGGHVSAKVLKGMDIHAEIVLSKVHKKLNTAKLRKDVAKSMELPVRTVLPFSEDVLLHESKGVFSKEYPKHAFSKAVKKLAQGMLNGMA